MGVTGLKHAVHEVLFPQHPAFPGRDLRHNMGEKTEGIVGWKYGNTKHVPHGDEDKEVLHAGACLQGVSCHAMGGHAIGKILQKPNNLSPNALFVLLWRFIFCHVKFSDPLKEFL